MRGGLSGGTGWELHAGEVKQTGCGGGGGFGAGGVWNEGDAGMGMFVNEFLLSANYAFWQVGGRSTQENSGSSLPRSRKGSALHPRRIDPAPFRFNSRIHALPLAHISIVEMLVDRIAFLVV